MNGILAIDKPKGKTSFYFVNKIKKLTKEKVGHTGTLDPLATGVLTLLVGEATKASNFLMAKDKVYEVEIFLGEKKDTFDSDGKTIFSSTKKDISLSDIKKVVSKYIGKLKQTPPMFSAIKKEGKPLYKLAREGKSIERKKRDVEIYSIKILDFNFPVLKLSTHVSKGTYIRSLADDIGEDLGTYGYVNKLRRLESFPFTESDLISFDKIESLDDLRKNLIPIENVIKKIMPSYEIDLNLAKKIVQGKSVSLTKEFKSKDNIMSLYAIKDGLENLVCIVSLKGYNIEVLRVFNYKLWI
jgi:tRNA pseudouridine55 synthase